MPRSEPELDVCLVAEGTYPYVVGGVTRWADGLIRGLPGTRFGVCHLGPRPASTPLLPDNVAGVWGSANAPPRARVYHALTPAAAGAAGPAARRAGRPLLLTCHALTEGWRPEGWRGPTPIDASQGPGGPGGPGGPKGRGYAAPEVIVAVSRAVAESHVARGARADRMLVVPNGAAAASARRAPAEPLVGFVGRLAPVKGLERLLGAFRMVRADQPEARLVLVGPSDGPPGYAEELRRLSVRLGIADAVDFPGASRPSDWYSRLTCLALASESEGMPMAVLEAMAHGVPCVVPDVGGCREAVGDAGIVVPARDVEALAEAIARLVGDAAEAARLGALAAERAGRWTEADAAAAYGALYTALGVPARAG